MNMFILNYFIKRLYCSVSPRFIVLCSHFMHEAFCLFACPLFVENLMILLISSVLLYRLSPSNLPNSSCAAIRPSQLCHFDLDTVKSDPSILVIAVLFFLIVLYLAQEKLKQTEISCSLSEEASHRFRHRCLMQKWSKEYFVVTSGGCSRILPAQQIQQNLSHRTFVQSVFFFISFYKRNYSFREALGLGPCSMLPLQMGFLHLIISI